MLGHARVSITLDVYTHLVDDARHTDEIRNQMAQSAFARLLAAASPASDEARLIALPGGRAT